MKAVHACIKGAVNVRNINNTHTHTHTHKYVTRVKQITVSVLSDSGVVYFLTIWFLIFFPASLAIESFVFISYTDKILVLYISLAKRVYSTFSILEQVETAAWTTNKSNLIKSNRINSSILLFRNRIGS